MCLFVFLMEEIGAANLDIAYINRRAIISGRFLKNNFFDPTTIPGTIRQKLQNLQIPAVRANKLITWF